MEAILDTNFIVSCIRKNIDFLSQLESEGFKVKLPREVYQELKDLRLKVGHDERLAVDLALTMLTNKKVKKTTLGHTTVDAGLIALGKKGAYIATLDAAIKREVPNKIFIRASQNGLEIQRA